ncbi:unnamed protein product, partial [marine sediment metagenome]
DLTIEEAIELAEGYSSGLSPLPDDAVLENASFGSLLKRTVVAEDGSLIDKSFYGYRVVFLRYFEDVPTSDAILLWIDTFGNLNLYDKTWTLSLPESSDPSIGEKKSISIAESVINGTSQSSELRIVRPNYYWDSNKTMYGDSNGRLSWVIVLDIGDSRQASVWVDAHSGDVVGGWTAL